MRFTRNDTSGELTAPVTIRPLTESQSDTAALRSLAERDSRPLPEGQVLGAEVEGRLLAAISLADGVVIADPFSPTGELRSLLELRAAQMRCRHARRRHSRGAEPRGHARAVLAGSPPGAGGRLLELP